MDFFVGAGRALVADIRGEAECLVPTCLGEIRYLEEDLPFSCVTAVIRGAIDLFCLQIFFKELSLYPFKPFRLAISSVRNLALPKLAPRGNSSKW